jgi:hypothetical protein
MARWRCRVLGPRPRLLIISLAGMRRLLNLEEVAAAAHSIRREGETCRRKTGASVFQVASLRAFIRVIGTFFYWQEYPCVATGDGQKYIITINFKL